MKSLHSFIAVVTLVFAVAAPTFAKADSGSVFFSITDLKLNFTKSSEENLYNSTGASMNCKAQVKVNGEVNTVDCSQSEQEGAQKPTLVFQKNGSTEALFTITTVKQDGSSQALALRGKVVQGKMNDLKRGGTVIFKMLDADAATLTQQLHLNNDDTQATVSVQVKGEGRMVMSGDSLEVDYPEIDVFMKVKVK